MVERHPNDGRKSRAAVLVLEAQRVQVESKDEDSKVLGKELVYRFGVDLGRHGGGGTSQ
jgi:hypothetical protein